MKNLSDSQADLKEGVSKVKRPSGHSKSHRPSLTTSMTGRKHKGLTIQGSITISGRYFIMDGEDLESGGGLEWLFLEVESCQGLAKAGEIITRRETQLQPL